VSVRKPIRSRAVWLLTATWLTAILLLLTSAKVNAATFRVDDTTSVPREPFTNMQWKSLAPGRAANHDVEGTAFVNVRLNLAPWVNKPGKIYMLLSPQPIGAVTAEWRTQGRLLPGRVVSGNRTLVFSGTIPSAFLEDTLAIKLETDGRRLGAPQRLEFTFEIDVE
jgi:hypothetical protein